MPIRTYRGVILSYLYVTHAHGTPWISASFLATDEDSEWRRAFYYSKRTRLTNHRNKPRRSRVYPCGITTFVHIASVALVMKELTFLQLCGSSLCSASVAPVMKELKPLATFGARDLVRRP